MRFYYRIWYLWGLLLPLRSQASASAWERRVGSGQALRGASMYRGMPPSEEEAAALLRPHIYLQLFIHSMSDWLLACLVDTHLHFTTGACMT